jgi:KAP-like P-loop domain-containing protein
MVADVLADAYGGSNPDAGRNFLEKIIQVPLNLPAADPKALREFCLTYIDRSLQTLTSTWDEPLRNDFLTKFYLYLAPRLDTPRSAKRYANALAFTMPLLLGEVHPLDVLLLEGMKIFYPRIYSAIRREPWAFTGSNDLFEFRKDDETSFEAVSRSLSDLNGDERERAQLFLEELFPQLRGLFRSRKFESSSGQERDRMQRVASADYLRRYMTLSIPEGDVPDRVIEHLLQELKALPDTEASEHLREFLGRNSAETTLYKIHVRLLQFDPASAGKLGLLIARSGDAFPKSTSLLAFGSIVHRAALLVRELLRQVADPTDRMDVAVKVVKCAEPLPFAYEFFMMLGPNPNDVGRDLLSAAAYNSLEKLLADRIRVEAEKSSLIAAFPRDYSVLLLFWCKAGGRVLVHAYTRKLMTGEPRNAVSILMAQYAFAPPSNTFSLRKFQELDFADPVDVRAAIQNLGSDSLTAHEQQTVTEFIGAFSQSVATSQPDGAASKAEGANE